MTRRLTASRFLGPLSFLTIMCTACGGQPEAPSVEVAAVWTGEEQKAFGEVLAAFEKRGGARVTYTSTGDAPQTPAGCRRGGGRQKGT